MLGMLRLVGTKTSKRMLFHSWEGLPFDRREVKIHTGRELARFADAVATAIAAYPPEPISLRDQVLRLNNTLISAAKTHVGKSKLSRYTKPWSTPELRAGIKQRNNLRRTVTENRTEYSTEVRKLTEEAHQKSGKNSWLTSNTIPILPIPSEPSKPCQVSQLQRLSVNLLYITGAPLLRIKERPMPSWKTPRPTGPERPWCTKTFPGRQTASPPLTGQMPSS